MKVEKTKNSSYAFRTVNWFVITGAPCSGKSSVIQVLHQKGFRVVHEVARAYIDGQLALGHKLNQIKADGLCFERAILDEKVRIEKTLPASELIFLDRAVPDSIAYYRIEGLDPNEPITFSKKVRYKKIFLFDRLDFIKDAVRSEDQKTADRIEKLLIDVYTDLGYPIIRVPILSVLERAELVLTHAVSIPP